MKKKGRKMPLLDKLYMPPIKKYEVYGKFPWKMVIHILLVMMTTAQIVLIVSASSAYSYHQTILWKKLFIVRDVSPGYGQNDLPSGLYKVYSAEQLHTFLTSSMEIFYNINNYTLDNYEHVWPENRPYSIPLEVRYLSDKFVSKDDEYLYYINLQDYGPLEKQKARSFIDRLQSFSLQLKFRHRLQIASDFSSDCYIWTINQLYDFSMHGSITVSLATELDTCRESKNCI